MKILNNVINLLKNPLGHSNETKTDIIKLGSDNSIQKEINKYLKEIGVNPASDNFSWYIDLCKVVDRYVHGKLPVRSIMVAQDKLSDLLTVGIPGFWVGPLSKSDRIRGQIRAMEIIPELKKANLTYDEKEALAFCVYYNTCIRTVDRKTMKPVMPLADFKSFDKIDAEYKYMKSSGLHDEQFRKTEIENKTGEYGYDISNPICVNSVSASYEYLKRLQPVEGIIVGIKRKGSRSKGDGIIDLWEIEVDKDGTKQISKLYINCYSTDPKDMAPSGFILK